MLKCERCPRYIDEDVVYERKVQISITWKVLPGLDPDIDWKMKLDIGVKGDPNDE